jgi:hypothetical protein
MMIEKKEDIDMTLNEKARRLIEIKALISSLEKEKKMIEDEFKEKGSFQTEDFDVSVSETTRLYSKGVEALFEAFGEAEVMAKGVVSQTTFKMIKVSKKAKAVKVA